MKKLMVIFLLVLVGVGIWSFIRQNKTVSPLLTPRAESPSPTSSNVSPLQGTSLFVPYWTIDSNTPWESYDTLIYFGVTPGKSGLNTEEPGYVRLTDFTEKAGGKRSYLTIRMLDSKQNFAILKNTSLQDRLINESISLAKENGFEGVVLDLEVSALPFASLLEQISSFNKRFYTAAHTADLHYAVTLYGDTFYRIRPFEVSSLGKYSDEIMIMAYDLHKARGNPGPNFPLGGKSTYGYDYSSLLDHFTKSVPKEKLTVIFGLFGYDWTVDDKRNMLAHGDPLSYNEIKQKFILNCDYSSCSQKRDPLSSESYISYTDTEGAKHLVWFEDMDSVAKKQKFLQTKGIASFSFWAYSYY